MRRYRIANKAAQKIYNSDPALGSPSASTQQRELVMRNYSASQRIIQARYETYYDYAAESLQS